MNPRLHVASHLVVATSCRQSAWPRAEMRATGFAPAGVTLLGVRVTAYAVINTAEHRRAGSGPARGAARLAGRRDPQDVPFDRTMTAAVEGEIKDLVHWFELDLTLPG